MRTYFIPYHLAGNIEDAALLAPNWVKAIVEAENGWLCFEKPPDADIWLGYDR